MKAKALFDYTPRTDRELAFLENDVIDVLTRDESGWWEGKLNGKVGWFPSSWVEALNSVRLDEALDAKQVIALFEFTSSSPHELSFKAGDIINIVGGGGTDGWCMGEKGGVTGLFPYNFVEVHDGADNADGTQADTCNSQASRASSNTTVSSLLAATDVPTPLSGITEERESQCLTARSNVTEASTKTTAPTVCVRNYQYTIQIGDSCSMADPEAKKVVTAYVVDVETTFAAWTVYRRYNHFVALDEYLRQSFPNEDFVKLPPRTLRSGAEVIEKRRKGLQEYLLGLIHRSHLVHSEEMTSFLELDNIWTAAFCGDVDKLSQLLQEGQDVNEQDKKGRTALHYASAEGSNALVEFLIDNGAKVWIPDLQGDTAEKVAGYCGHNKIIALLQAKAEEEEKQKGTNSVRSLTKVDSAPVISELQKRNEELENELEKLKLERDDLKAIVDTHKGEPVESSGGGNAQQGALYRRLVNEHAAQVGSLQAEVVASKQANDHLKATFESEIEALKRQIVVLQSSQDRKSHSSDVPPPPPPKPSTSPAGVPSMSMAEVSLDFAEELARELEDRNAEIRQLEETLESERSTHLAQIDRLKVELADLKVETETEINAVRQKGDTSSAQFRQEMNELISELDGLRQETAAQKKLLEEREQGILALQEELRQAKAAATTASPPPTPPTVPAVPPPSAVPPTSPAAASPQKMPSPALSPSPAPSPLTKNAIARTINTSTPPVPPLSHIPSPVPGPPTLGKSRKSVIGNLPSRPVGAGPVTQRAAGTPCEQFDPNPFRPTICKECRLKIEDHERHHGQGGGQHPRSSPTPRASTGSHDGSDAGKWTCSREGCECSNFEVNPFKPTLCKHCRHPNTQHRV